MTFRDDHDAALARAEALDIELKRAEAERDALKEELAKRPPAEPKRKQKSKRPPSPTPDEPTDHSEPSVKGKHMAIFMALAIAVLAIILVPAFRAGQRKRDARAAWRTARAAIEQHKAHWRQLISVEPCVRDVALDTMGPVSHRRPEVFDPRRDSGNFGYDLGGIAENCGYPVREIANDPKWPATVRDPLRTWMSIETELTAAVKPLDDYMSNRDWQDDNYRGGLDLWGKLLAIITRRNAALAVVRKDVLPILRDEIKQLQAAHLAKFPNGTRDEIWWRIELGIAQWSIDEIALESSGVYAGRDFDVAAATLQLQKPVAALLARLPDASVSVRRQFRTIEWITTPLVAGEVPQGETPLWHMVHSEADLIAKLYDEMIPALPPDPGPEPEDNSD